MLISNLAELVSYNAIFQNFYSSSVLANCFSTFKVLLVSNSLSHYFSKTFLQIGFRPTESSSSPEHYHASYANFCHGPWLKNAFDKLLRPILSCNNEITKLVKSTLIRLIVLINNSLKCAFLTRTSNASDN